MTKIKGYKEQSDFNINLVNFNKTTEENILRLLDDFLNNPDIDKRWLNIGRTHIEQGFMAINRSILQPNRVTSE